MKKVLYTATVDFHIKQFHLPYLQWLKEQGYEVHVATNTNEPIPYCDVKHKISFERMPFKWNNIKAIRELKKIIDQEKFNIIHTHTPMGSTITRMAAMKARKEYHTKVIYTAHGFHFFKGASFINWCIYYPVEKLLAKVTDYLITINQEDYELAKKRLKAKKIKLINGVGVDKKKFDFNMTDKEKLELKQTLGIKEEDFVIIYVAELTKRKNQGMLLKAIKKMKEDKINHFKVLLVGRDDRNGYYQKMAKTLQIEEEIKFLGYRKDVPKLMKIANLAVSTSRQEGMPFNILEAMIGGLPIIATDCRGNRDLIRDCIEIGDVKILARRIKDQKNKKTKKVKYDIKKYEIDEIKEKIAVIYQL